MTTFAYTTGDPAKLTGGANASMNDIQGPFTDLRTFLNGATLDSTNIAHSMFAQYVNVPVGALALAGGAGAQTYVPLSSSAALAVGATAGTPLACLHFQPTDYAIAGLSLKLRLRTSYATGSTVPGVNFSVSLCAISGLASAANAVGVSSLATVAASTAVLTSPAFSADVLVGPDFSAPAAGVYIVSVTPSGGTAANSFIGFTFDLQFHYA